MRSLSDLGFREFELVKDLLDAWMSCGLPPGFVNEGAQIFMDTDSGTVFLTNVIGQYTVLEDDKLVIGGIR
jgi:hypothetical protein